MPDSIFALRSPVRCCLDRLQQTGPARIQGRNPPVTGRRWVLERIDDMHIYYARYLCRKWRLRTGALNRGDFPVQTGRRLILLGTARSFYLLWRW